MAIFTNTKDQWIVAGLNMLEKEGHASMSIERIARTINMTRGSFYHHFKNRDDFILELLLAYEKQYVDDLLNDAVLEKTSLAIINRYIQISTTQSQLEIMFRAWSLSDSLVKTYQERIDYKRLKFAKDITSKIFTNQQQIETVSNIAHAYLIGARQIGFRKNRTFPDFIATTLNAARKVRVF